MKTYSTVDYQGFFEAVHKVCDRYNIELRHDKTSRFRALLLDEYPFVHESELREVFCTLDRNGVVRQAAQLGGNGSEVTKKLIEFGISLCHASESENVAAVVFAISDRYGCNGSDELEHWLEEYYAAKASQPTDGLPSIPTSYASSAQVTRQPDVNNEVEDGILNGNNSSTNNAPLPVYDDPSNGPSSVVLWRNFILFILMIIGGIYLINSARGHKSDSYTEVDSAQVSSDYWTE